MICSSLIASTLHPYSLKKSLRSLYKSPEMKALAKSFKLSLYISCCLLLLSVIGSSFGTPKYDQSNIKSISSDIRLITPYTFERLVPPLKVNNLLYLDLSNK